MNLDINQHFNQFWPNIDLFMKFWLFFTGKKNAEIVDNTVYVKTELQVQLVPKKKKEEKTLWNLVQDRSFIAC